MIERIKQNKSLVDIKLTARACQEHYQKQVDSFVIVSSDSDYWGLISSLPDARFLVMIEREKCGPDMKAALAESGIFYCYLDDFYSGNSEDIKKNACKRSLPKNTNCPKRHSTKTKFIRSKSPYDVLGPPDHGLQ
jgi:hypothetical protein